MTKNKVLARKENSVSIMFFTHETFSISEPLHAIIFSTHSPEQALMNATDVIAISGGRISFAGKPDELLDGRVLEELYSRDLCIKRIDTGRSSRIICVPR